MPIDFSIAWKTGARIVNEITSLLPNLILGLLIFILFSWKRIEEEHHWWQPKAETEDRRASTRKCPKSRDLDIIDKG
jgi:hypothetical protein